MWRRRVVAESFVKSESVIGPQRFHAMRQIHLIDVARADVFLRTANHPAELLAGGRLLEMQRRRRFEANRFREVSGQIPQFMPALIGVPEDQRVLIETELESAFILHRSS